MKHSSLVPSALCLIAAAVMSACSGEPSSEGAAGVVKVAEPAIKPVPAVQEDPSIASSSCHIDDLVANGKRATPGTPLHVPREGGLNVSGWVSVPDADVVPPYVGFRLFGASVGKVWEIKVPTGGARPDVARSTGRPALAASGFAFTGDVSGLQPGTYHAYLAFDHEGRSFSCNGGDSIIVQ